MSGKALELYSAALGDVAHHLVAFESEARAGARSRAAARSPITLLQHPPQDEAVPPEPPRFRCEECGVASTTWHWRCPSCRNWDSLRSTQ